jgi:hypothetical protein
MMIKQARKHKVEGGYSKYGLCMNTAYRNLGQFTAQRKDCHLMKPWPYGVVAWNLGGTIMESNKIWSAVENGVCDSIGL